MMAGVALAAPGGYTGIGGVYKELNQDADYIHLAKNAAKMQIDLFQDESFTTDEEVPPAMYVPSTFFISVPQESVPSQVATRFWRMQTLFQYIKTQTKAAQDSSKSFNTWSEISQQPASPVSSIQILQFYNFWLF